MVAGMLGLVKEHNTGFLQAEQCHCEILCAAPCTHIKKNITTFYYS